MAGPRSFLLRAATPIQKVMQKIGNPEPKITSKFVNQLEAMIQPGDILGSREDWRFTNLFIPGYWSHIAVYVGGGYVVEAIGTGVRIITLEEFCYTKDSVFMLRVHKPKIMREHAAIRARSIVGKKYDYIFNSTDEEFYCSEVADYAYNGAFKLPNRISVTPEEVYKSSIGRVLIEERNC